MLQIIDALIKRREERLLQDVKVVAFSAATLYAGLQLAKYGIWRYRNSKVERLARLTLEERNSKTYQFKTVEQEELILSLNDVAEIREHLIKGSFACEDLVHVYAQRCYTIGRALNLSTVENFDEAFELGKIKDEELQEAIRNGTVDQLPPLHGIPMSFKDNIDMKGLRSSIGTQFLCDYIAQEDSITVQLFRKAGAIPLVKGNMPQAGLSANTLSRVWGEAQNPHNKSRSCGGSTGGDAGLIAARCIPLSIGTDIGGSIRIPAAFNGIIGFKPTARRTSSKGQKQIIDPPLTFDKIQSTQGPLSLSVDNLKLAFQIQQDPLINLYDHKVAPIPFREDLYQYAKSGNNVKIGYIDSLPTIPVTPAIMRSMNIAKQALESQGYELVPLNFTIEEVYAYRNTFAALMCHGVTRILSKHIKMQGEKFIPHYEGINFYYNTTNFARFMLRSYLRVIGNKRLLDLIAYSRPINERELTIFENNIEHLHSWMRSKFSDLNIQAILMPVYPACSFDLSNSVDMNIYLDYSILWNILHYPCGTVPVSEVMEGEDNPELYQDGYNDQWTKTIRKDMQGSVGMPIGLQIVAQSFQDEVVLGVMKALDDKIKYRKVPQTMI